MEVETLNTETETNTETNTVETNEEVQQEQPQLLAGKYKDKDNLIKGIEHTGNSPYNKEDLEGLSTDYLEKLYKSLEKGQEPETNQEENFIEKETNTETENNTETETQVEELDTSDNKDYYKILEENYDKDNLMELLEGSGMPETFIKNYINGKKTEITSKNNEIYESVGGLDKYNEVIKWASKELPQSEKVVLKKILDSGDSEVIMFNIKNLQNRYNNSTKQSLSGDSLKTNNLKNLDVYTSRDEWKKDLTSSKFGYSSDYQKYVQDKYLRSKKHNSKF